MTNWLQFTVTYTEEWRRTTTVAIDEDEIREWIVMDNPDYPGTRFAGEITGRHVQEFLDSGRNDDRPWAKQSPIDQFEDEYVDSDIEDVKPVVAKET